MTRKELKRVRNEYLRTIQGPHMARYRHWLYEVEWHVVVPAVHEKNTESIPARAKGYYRDIEPPRAFIERVFLAFSVRYWSACFRNTEDKEIEVAHHMEMVLLWGMMYTSVTDTRFRLGLACDLDGLVQRFPSDVIKTFAQSPQYLERIADEVNVPKAFSAPPEFSVFGCWRRNADQLQSSADALCEAAGPRSDTLLLSVHALSAALREFSSASKLTAIRKYRAILGALAMHGVFERLSRMLCPRSLGSCHPVAPSHRKALLSSDIVEYGHRVDESTLLFAKFVDALAEANGERDRVYDSIPLACNALSVLAAPHERWPIG